MSLDSKYPFLIRSYNRLFSAKKIDYKALLKAAEKSIGHSDFGEAAFIPRLEYLCKIINEEAKLHAFGTFITKERLKGVLSNRLRAVEFMKQHPDVLQTVLQPPILIAGLQRTGTTFLQRLLAADSDNRALLAWEALNPIPFKEKNEEQKRIKQALISQKALNYISPTFFSIHPVEFNSPEEDVLLNDMTLLSAVAEATMHVPTYSKWVAAQDHGIAYDWMIKMLQILQYQKPSKTWILKTPQHLEYMDVVAEKFPQATVIHTHRDPKECIPSFCSMVYHSRKIFSAEVDALEVAEHWLNKNVYMLQQTMKVRQENPNFRIIDVEYKDLVKNPIGTIQSIYSQIGRTWNERIENEIKQAITNNKKDKYGQHHYDMKDFGLTDAGIDKAFDFCLSHYIK